MSPATANTTPSAPSAASSSARTPPCCNVYNGHPKMLESLLYNFHQHINSFAAVAALSAAQQQQQSPVPAASAVAGVGSPPAAMSPVAIASAAAAAAMASQSQSPRAAASPASSHDSHRHNPIHRPRSGSVVSLGSTGSSFRDSYSPSHESSTSHDSFSRGSPASVGSSPSPSPPAHENSKLFGILKGTVTSPYSSYFNGHHVAPRTRTPTNRTHTPTHSAHSPMVATSPVAVKRAYVAQDDDEQPMDLSCKRLRSDTPNSSPSTPLSPPDLESPPATGGSILQSILCGGSSSSSFFGNNHSSSLSNKSSTRSPSRSTCSPAPRPAQRQARRESTSSVSSSSSSTSLSRCSATRSRVALAKKMMQPVLARVSDWMLKVVQFAKSQPEFVSLPSQKDKLALLSQAWARILLLFMAETNFEFVVTPINSEEDDGKWDSECPTMQSVQKIQAFITKCQNLKMDAQEYHLMRMTMLFYSGESNF
jgi:hypothetical protein